MKSKFFKSALALTSALSLLGINMFSAVAKNLDTTGLETEYEMLELERTKPGTNLIKNGGFETNKGQYWSTTGDGQITDYPGAAHNSKVCGLLPSFSKNASVYQTLSLEKNKEYKVTAKVLSADAAAQAIVAIKTPNVENLNPAIEQAITFNEAWQYQDLTFTFNSGENSEVALAFIKWTESTENATYKSQIYIDDVTLSQIGAETTPNDEKYEVIWKDEFDGTGAIDNNGLDNSKWGYELGCIRGVEQQHYTKDKENVHVDDGKLVLEVTDRAKESQYKNPRGDRQVIYNSGSVRTHGKQDFLFGRIEVLAKLPEGQATFPAFWTLGSDFTLDGSINGDQGDGWPLSGEIDIMESIGDPNFVYETLHYSDTNKPGYTPGADNGKYAGNGKGSKITTPGVVIDGETYHVFGINWSEGKMEWYIDDQIVRSVDYSDDPAAKAALDRPQYIQLNFATGGNWPGDAGSNLAGQTFKVEYAYYAQNQEQKAAAEKYYANTAALNVKDLSMVEGVVPDLLNEATLTAGSELVDLSEYTIDYSIDNEHMFTTNPDLNDNSQSNDQNQTKVECLIDGAASKEKIAKLAPGEYNIHYSAMHDSKPSVRKTAKLTVVEKPLLPSDMDLEGVIGNKLESIALPEGWGWVNPNMVIDTHTGEYEIIYTKVDFSNPVKVTVRATEKADVDTIAPTEKPSKDNTSVKTGDNALVATFAMLGTISLAGITLLKKKN